MRVIHVITRLIVGGAQENTIASVLGLQRKPGLQVKLLSGPSIGPEGSLESTLAGAPGTLRIIPALVRPILPWKDFAALRQLTRVFKEERPDLVHTHSGKAGILGRLAAARARVPIIVHTLHGPSFGAFQNRFANELFRFAERDAARVTTHFVSVADALTEQYLAAGVGHRGQYTTIRSGLDLDAYRTLKNDVAVRGRFDLGVDDIIVGKISRLFKLKGHDDLIAIAPELVRRCPRMKFLLVGDGRWRERLQRKVRSLNLEKHFVFRGLAVPDAIPELAGIMDIVVHLSRREGLARALPQALAAGKPVVAYDCDGAKEVCLENRTGFLISSGDWVGLIDRLLRLANDPALRERLGSCGREFVRERFGIERMVDELHALYLRLAGDRRLANP